MCVCGGGGGWLDMYVDEYIITIWPFNHTTTHTDTFWNNKYTIHTHLENSWSKFYLGTHVTHPIHMDSTCLKFLENPEFSNHT